MKKIRKMTRVLALSLGGLVVAGGCQNLTSPNFNFADLDDLVNNPTPSSVNAAVQGLLVGYRAYMGNGGNDFVSVIGIIGRESYNMDVADPRYESELLRQLNNGGFGAGLWAGPYANIRLGDIALRALNQLGDGEYPEDKKEWARAFTKFMNALDFLTIVNTRDDNCGCAITVPEGVEPAPEVGKEAVFDHIESLLVQAAGHASSASGGPLFQITSGFEPGSGTFSSSGFDTADEFLRLIRGLQARVAVYRGKNSEALNFLAGSFLDTSEDLRKGAYIVFGTGSGDQTNGYFEPGTSPNLRPHPSLEQDVEQNSSGDDDLRFTAKTRSVESRGFQGLCSPQSQFPDCVFGFDIYTSLEAAIPMIRNEELILLRAEANIGLNQLGPAETDINFIRANSGGLDPVTLTSANAVDRLLYEKRLSLMFEGGHRWIDMRRHNRLGDLPLDLPGHTVEPRYPIPIQESTARQGN